MFLFSLNSIAEVSHWCWAIRPGSQLVFQFIAKNYIGLCAGQFGKSISLWTCLCAQTGKGQTQTVATQLEAQYCLRYYMLTVWNGIMRSAEISFDLRLHLVLRGCCRLVSSFSILCFAWQDFIFGDVFCKAVMFFQVCGIYLSMLTLTAMSFER